MKARELIDLYEMSNYGERDTGLPDKYKVWIKTVTDKKPPHSDYRVKIKSAEREWTFLIPNSPEDSAIRLEGKGRIPSKDEKLIKAFIDINRDSLRKHINNEIDSGELVDELRKNKNNLGDHIHGQEFK